MRVKCKCGSKAIITTSEQISEEVTRLYCQCTNTLCNSSFVSLLSFSHYRVEPETQTMETIKKLIFSMSEREKAELLQISTQPDLFNT